MGLEHEIEKPISDGFRRAFIKRRQLSDGKFETSYQNISSRVKAWGKVSFNTDHVRFNKFTHQGTTLKVLNDDGFFNKETDNASFWSGYLTRYRSLVKIEAGYEDASGTEFPTDSTLGVYILDNEIPINGTTLEATLQCKSLKSLFDEVPAVDVAGLGATATASEIIAKIRDHTDGSANTVFREFITSTSWSIQSTTTNYNLATSTSLDGLSCWKLMEKLSESEGNIIRVTRTGGIEFRDRTGHTTASQFSFNGMNTIRPNVIKLDLFKESLNTYFNFFRFKYRSADTSTSFVSAGTTTAVDPSNVSWIFGSRQYEFANTFVATSSVAQTIVNNLFSRFGATIKQEIKFSSVLAPSVEVADRIDFTYKSFTLEGTSVWDEAVWDTDVWPAAQYDTFDFENKAFIVSSVNHDLNKFKSTFVAREA